jgi:hypothetical protein
MQSAQKLLGIKDTLEVNHDRKRTSPLEYDQHLSKS